MYPAARTADDSARARAYVDALVAAAYHGQPRVRVDSLVALLRDRPWFFEPPALTDPYWSFSRSFARYRPLDWWSRVRVPVLLLYGRYGAEDRRLPPTSSGWPSTAPGYTAGLLEWLAKR